jgi:hypothetical protein
MFCDRLFHVLGCLVIGTFSDGTLCDGPFGDGSFREWDVLYVNPYFM